MPIPTQLPPTKPSGSFHVWFATSPPFQRGDPPGHSRSKLSQAKCTESISVVVLAPSSCSGSHSLRSTSSSITPRINQPRACRVLQTSRTPHCPSFSVTSPHSHALFYPIGRLNKLPNLHLGYTTISVCPISRLRLPLLLLAIGENFKILPIATRPQGLA